MPHVNFNGLPHVYLWNRLNEECCIGYYKHGQQQQIKSCRVHHLTAHLWLAIVYCYCPNVLILSTFIRHNFLSNSIVKYCENRRIIIINECCRCLFDSQCISVTVWRLEQRYVLVKYQEKTNVFPHLMTMSNCYMTYVMSRLKFLLAFGYICSISVDCHVKISSLPHQQ